MSFTSRSASPSPLHVEDANSLATSRTSYESKSERQHREICEKLSSLLNKFQSSRIGLYEEIQANLEKELRQVFEGGFEEYTEQIEELNILCEEKLVAASLHRDHHISQLEKEYEAELERAQIEYVKEKESLKERMIVQIEEKKKKLREDKDLLEITNDIAIESSARVHNTRKHRKKDANHHDGRPSSKRRHMTADVMILQLKDQDISQDIALIQKGHGQQLSECSDEETNTSTSNHHCNGSSHKKSTKHRR